MDSPGDLAPALHIIERDGSSLGLNLNRTKSLLFIPEESDASLSPLTPDIPIIHGGFTLLGCPIGPPSYCKVVFGGRVAKVKSSLGALRDIGNSQLESTLLRSCLALPKVSFIHRTCHTSHICLATVEFDHAMRDALEAILGGPMSDWSWLKDLFPAAVVVSTFTVLRSMLLLPSSPHGPDPCS